MGIKKQEQQSQLIENILLNKDVLKLEWQSIRKQFIEIYPNFYIEFIKNGIQLSISEERFLLLEKIGLSTKNIATVLGVYPESIHKNRYRLRKKINNTSINSTKYFNETNNNY